MNSLCGKILCLILYQSDSCREPVHILEKGGDSEIREVTTSLVEILYSILQDLLGSYRILLVRTGS